VERNHCNVVTLDDPVAALGPENLIDIIHIKKKIKTASLPGFPIHFLK
jgi:hypothetical protein